MKVVLNLVYLVPGETGGMETYARHLIPALAELPGLELLALVSRDAAEAPGPWGTAAPMEVVPVSARNRVEWVRGEQQHVPRMADRAGADVLHSLASTAPLWGRARRVTTIHDLNYKLVPGTHFGLRGLGMRLLVPAAARRSHRIVVDAHSTKEDLVRYLRVPPSRIDVAPLAVSALPDVTPVESASLREKLGLGSRQVVLSVSAKRPHKNLVRLLDALAGIPPERRPILVVPGYPTPHEAMLREHAEAVGVADDVRWPAWLATEELEGLYSLAVASVFPSLYEGFGLPVLEAMARGLPVATSNRSSLPEVAGDAALLFDPEDTTAIRQAIERLLADATERLRLQQAGLARVERFTWASTAALTLGAYERALADPSS